MGWIPYPSSLNGYPAIDQPATQQGSVGFPGGYLRGLDPVVGYEMARAAIGASMVYLRERFGEVHAFEIADDLACRIMAEAVLMRAAPSTAGLH